jgi:hypothetical protein
VDEDVDLGQVMVARSAQVAAVAAMVAENTARMRASRTAVQATRDEAAARAARAAARAATSRARTTYGAALEPGWAQTAPTVAAGRVWAAAVPYADTDPYAARAQRIAEARLRDLHPHGLRRYDELRAAGVDARPAMREAVPLFLQPPDTPTVTATVVDSAPTVDPGLAGEADAERGHAARDAATRDDPVTPADEATTGRRAADRHTAAADTAAAAATESGPAQRWTFPAAPRPTAPATTTAAAAAAARGAGAAPAPTPRPARR